LGHVSALLTGHLLELFVGYLAFEGLKLLDEHVVEGVQVFSELSSGSASAHPLE